MFAVTKICCFNHGSNIDGAMHMMTCVLCDTACSGAQQSCCCWHLPAPCVHLRRTGTLHAAAAKRTRKLRSRVSAAVLVRHCTQCSLTLSSTTSLAIAVCYAAWATLRAPLPNKPKQPSSTGDARLISADAATHWQSLKQVARMNDQRCHRLWNKCFVTRCGS